MEEEEEKYSTRLGRVIRPPIPFDEQYEVKEEKATQQQNHALWLSSSLEAGWLNEPADEAAAEELLELKEEEGEEEEEEDAEAMQVMEEEWTDKLHDIAESLPPRHAAAAAANVGANVAAMTPLELLQLSLPAELVHRFASYTNANAPSQWCGISGGEVYGFLAAHIFMGIVQLPRTAMYWSEQYGQQFIQRLFSRDKFMQMLQYFSVVETVEGDDSRDPMPHVRELAAQLNASFQQHFQPSHFLCIDEAMAAFKGRAAIKQYIPSKPHKWGYKIFCLCSENYLLRFEIHEGAAEQKSEHGATYDLCLRLTDGYGGKDRILFTDQYFTSPSLMRALKERDIRLCGAVSAHRKGMPPISGGQTDSLKQGEWIQRQKGDMIFAAWQSRRLLRLLYNHCSPSGVSSQECWVSGGSKFIIPCPSAVNDYFIHARDVDVLSQLHYGYRTGRNSMRCWPRLAWWLLDVCIVNAYTLWAKQQQSPSGREQKNLWSICQKTRNYCLVC